MNNQTTLPQKEIKCKKTILILSVVSLAFILLGSVAEHPLLFYSFYSSSNLELLLLFITPCILFALYVFIFFKKLRGTCVVPIIFAWLLLYWVQKCIYDIIYYFNGWIIFNTSSFFVIKILQIIFDIVLPLLFIMTIVYAMKGFSNKFFLKSAVMFGIIRQILEILEILEIFIRLRIIAGKLEHMVGTIIFYIALLLFFSNNRIPSVLLSVQVKNYVSNRKYEEAFNLLKKEYESGFMTEEEYQIQRTKILNKV